MRKLLDDIQYAVLLNGCRLIGLLPDAFLYNYFAPFAYYILRFIVRYRVGVVKANLAKSFPEKSYEERREIDHKFYRHLSEVLVDTVKMASISKDSIMQRMQYRNVEAHEEAMRGQSWLAAMSHFGSWELTVNYVCNSDHRLLAVYRPLHSVAFDRYYQYVRSRFGTQPVAMNDILREIVTSQRKGGQPVAVALIADQTPPAHEIKYWYNFLNQDTPFFSGMEKIARKFHTPIFFTYVRQVSPQHYEAEFEMIYDGKEDVDDNEITKRYVKRLETMIRETPHLWMWSHRRWKHHRR